MRAKSQDSHLAEIVRAVLADRQFISALAGGIVIKLRLAEEARRAQVAARPLSWKAWHRLTHTDKLLVLLGRKPCYTLINPPAILRALRRAYGSDQALWPRPTWQEYYRKIRNKPHTAGRSNSSPARRSR